MRKFRKRIKWIVCTLLVALMSSTIISSAAEKNNSIENTDFLAIYTANLAFEEGNNPINNGVTGYKGRVKSWHDIGHPSGIVMDKLNQTDSFMLKLQAFSALTADPSKFTGQTLQEGEFYTAVLLSMMNITTTNTEAVDAYNSKYTVTATDAGSWLLNGMKEEYNISIGPNTKLADVDRNKLKTYFQKMLQDKYNLADGADKGIAIFNAYVDTVTTVQELVNVMSSYICIYNAEKETFAVLREMKEHTTNTSMKYALNKIVACEQKSLATVSNMILEGGTKVFKTTYKTVVGTVWSDIALSSPAAAIYISQKASAALCNFCFSTDAISEQYWKMDALCNVEETLYEAYNSLGKAYITNKSAQNARNYNRAVDLYFNLYRESGEYAKTYADIIYKDSMFGIWSESDDYKNFVKSVTSMQQSANLDYESMQTGYVFFLEEDYPELYKRLMDYDMGSVIIKKALKNPYKSADGAVTWDAVYFGHYPQSADGKGGFKNEPIKWRVLSANGNDAFLLADKNLDAGSYNEEYTDVTWETCTMRNWLNSSFMNKAFSNGEQNAIRTTNVVNKDNPEYGTEGGNNTQDKVFLLSIEEVMNPAYGFPNNDNSTETREAVNTAYTASKDSWLNDEGETEWWWLRSPGSSSTDVSEVFDYGDLHYYGDLVSSSRNAVRPALHLDLSSNLWSYAGTVKCGGIKKNDPPKAKVKPGKATLTKVSSPKARTLKATWKKDTKASGYQVVIAQNSKFTKGKKTAAVTKNSTTSKTFSKLKKKATYYVKVRAYKTAGKTKLYGAYSSVKKVKIK